jgi:hypothetical protein
MCVSDAHVCVRHVVAMLLTRGVPPPAGYDGSIQRYRVAQIEEHAERRFRRMEEGAFLRASARAPARVSACLLVCVLWCGARAPLVRGGCAGA